MLEPTTSMAALKRSRGSLFSLLILPGRPIAFKYESLPDCLAACYGISACVEIEPIIILIEVVAICVSIPVARPALTSTTDKARVW